MRLSLLIPLISFVQCIAIPDSYKDAVAWCITCLGT